MSSEAQLRRACEALGSDPLFTMSRGSKELFRTNLLGWVAERHPAVFAAVFAQWLVPDDGPPEPRVRREWQHLDLLVELPGFALPDETQLERYSESKAVRALSSLSSFVLLTLDRPEWQEKSFGTDRRIWRVVPLESIADDLESAATGTTFDDELIRREAGLLRSLGELRAYSALSSEDQPYLLAPTTRGLLAEHRLDLAVQKSRASQLRQWVARNYELEGISLPTFELEASASHGEALTSALWSDSNHDGVGWQVQGGGWHLAMLNRSQSGRDEDSRKRRIETAQRNGDWFDFSYVHDVFGGGSALFGQ